MPREPLRCKRLEVVEVALPFRFTVRHAAAARKETTSLLVILHDDQGNRGFGEIVTRSYLTGETPESALEDLRGWWPKLQALVFPAEAAPAGGLWSLYDDADRRGRTAAYAGLDLAVHDLWGRRFGVAGSKLLGETETPVEAKPATAMVGLGGWSFGLAAGYRALGFREYKVKVGGTELASDVRRVAAVRRAVGRGASLRVDANGAWDEEHARAAMAAMAPYGVVCVEQPVGASRGGSAPSPPEDDAAVLNRLSSDTWLPVMADESLCTRADAARLLAAGGDVLWNLRLAKVGGFTGLLELARLARENAVRCQLGALVGETALLTAAARACLGVLDFAWVESSFSGALLRHDPFRPSAPLSPRLAPLGDEPGLGVTPDERALAAVTVRRCEMA